MWDVKGALIQVEIGSGLVSRYSNKKLFGRSADDGKLLLGEFAALREKLKAENIHVPQICCRDDAALGKQEFVVYVGWEVYKSNAETEDIKDVLECMIRRVQIPSVSRDGVHRQMDLANEHLSQGRWKDCLKCLSAAYFWASLLEDCEEEAVDAILQIGRILIQNNYLEHAGLCAQRAAFLTAPPFCNPYLKCASIEFAAVLNVLSGDFPAADRAYAAACQVIAAVPGANLLKISVLSAYLQTLQLCGNYVRANQIAQSLIDVLSESGCADLSSMYQLKSKIADCAIRQLETEYMRPRQQNKELTAQYNDVLKELRFHERFRSVAIVAIWVTRDILLPCLLGSMTANGNGKACASLIGVYVNKGKINDVRFG